jgi:hypothetical protein
VYSQGQNNTGWPESGTPLPAISSLAKLSPSNLVKAGDIRIVLKAYFDGSRNDRAESITLAAVAADESLWVDFENQWRIILDNCGNAPYCHMKEAMKLEGAFKGWRPEARDYLIGGLADILQDFSFKDRFRDFPALLTWGPTENGRRLGGCHHQRDYALGLFFQGSCIGMGNFLIKFSIQWKCFLIETKGLCITYPQTGATRRFAAKIQCGI